MAFHIVFPAMTIGLASYLAMLEFLWLATRRDVYMSLYRFWLKIFAVSFGMGVVSGVVMSYQFGTNWSRFSDAGGAVIGPLMSYEVITAFFLEASFLGVMLFGQKKVGERLHFFATAAVATGSLMSAFWILAANSFMQTPQGYAMVDGRLQPADWLAIIFNPSFPYRFVHMVLGAYLTTGFLVGGISAWYLGRGRAVAEARMGLSMALWFVAVMAPLQLIAGDQHGLEVRRYQPAKLAAMEGLWDTRGDVPIALFAIPDQKGETNHAEISLPHLGSLILTHSWHGEVTGLKAFPPQDRPPVLPVFFAFRVMVGIGLAMLGVAALGLFLRWRGRLYDARWFHTLAMLMTPSGFIAVIAGWITAEVGRQPYVIYGVLRTVDATSPLRPHQVTLSLAIFLIGYTVIFGFGTVYMLKIIAAGPGDLTGGAGKTGRPQRPLSLPDEPHPGGG